MPRVYSTGTILYGADGDFRAMVDSLDDARHHLKRLKAQGAWSVKSYNQPRRDQRQQINQAARELGMIVVMEGGSTFFHNLSMIIDGSTGVEHNLPVAPLYADMIGLWSRTQVGNTPTLVVAYGGLSGEYWWYEHSDVWQKQRLLNFFPSEALDGRSIRRQKAPDSEYFHITVSESVNALRQAGVPIMVGGHGQMQGLGTLWEMWLIGQGGMPNAQVLEAGTIAGARYLGLDADLGSLEVGKLADLLVLPGNPLEDLMVLEQVEQTMVNGQLFDSQTMAQIAPVAKPAPEFYWQRHGVGRAQAQRLFHEEMLARGRGGEHQILVQIGLGADDHGRRGVVGPDRGDVIHHRGVEFRRVLRRAGGVVIPHRGDTDVITGLQAFDKARSVDVSASHQGDIG